MVISHICTQGFFLHWKTLDQLAGSFSCIDTVYCVIHSFVCLLVLSLSRSFVRWLVRLFARPSFRSFVRSYVKFVCLLVYSFVHSIDSWIDRSIVGLIVSCFSSSALLVLLADSPFQDDESLFGLFAHSYK